MSGGKCPARDPDTGSRCGLVGDHKGDHEPHDGPEFLQDLDAAVKVEARLRGVPEDVIRAANREIALNAAARDVAEVLLSAKIAGAASAAAENASPFDRDAWKAAQLAASKAWCEVEQRLARYVAAKAAQ